MGKYVNYCGNNGVGGATVFDVFWGKSLWGLIANPLVLGLVPVLMSLGLGLSVMGYIWWPLAQLVGWVALPLARLWIETVMLVGSLPGGW